MQSVFHLQELGSRDTRDHEQRLPSHPPLRVVHCLSLRTFPSLPLTTTPHAATTNTQTQHSAIQQTSALITALVAARPHPDAPSTTTTASSAAPPAGLPWASRSNFFAHPSHDPSVRPAALHNPSARAIHSLAAGLCGEGRRDPLLTRLCRALFVRPAVTRDARPPPFTTSIHYSRQSVVHQRSARSDRDCPVMRRRPDEFPAT